MDSYIIQLKNQKALQIIRGLEELDLIKIIKSNIESPKPKSFADKYYGKISKETAEEMQKYVTKSREEWGNRLI